MKRIIYIISALVYFIVNESYLCAQVDSLVYVPVQTYEFGNTKTSIGYDETSVMLDRFQTESTETILRRWNTEVDNNIQPLSYSARTLNDDDTEYDVGEISYQEDITHTGGRVYDVPIMLSPLVDFASPLSLQYNSQTGNGVAGYGWNISGLSSIDISNRNLFYHGSIAPASIIDTSAVYALDGVPLLHNDDTILALEYPLETAQGHILVKKHMSGNTVSYFTVLFPDGSKAIYGEPDNHSSKISYPITEREDKFGNKIIYRYNCSGSEYYISDIFYIREDGDTSESYIGRILFEYENRVDYHTLYFAGESIEEDKILKRIVSESTYLDVLCEYRLSYEMREGVNLLVSIDCANSENKQLRPLKFTYGDNATSNSLGKDFKETDDIFLDKFFSNESAEIIYARGKFGKNNYLDGLVMYPFTSNYGVIELKNGNRKFGSRYSPDQSIILAPRSSQFGFMTTTITAEEGFQCIDVVDVDGDGTDEVVKVNFVGTEGDFTILGIKVYAYDASSFLFKEEKVFTIRTKGVFKEGAFTSPSQRCYHYGDFRGDGKKQLLTITYNTDPDQNLVASYTCLVDLEEEMVLYDENLFSLPVDDYVVCLDVDNDGRTELCRYTYPGFNIYNLSGNSFSLSRHISTPSDLNFYAKFYYTDINADGYVDIITSSNGIRDTWTIYINTGNSFIRKDIDLVANNVEDADFHFFDVNNDGLPDFIHRIEQRLNIYLNENGTFNKENKIISQRLLPEKSKVVPYNILQYNTMSDFITIGLFNVNVYDFTQDLIKDRLLTGFTNSLGLHTVNNYENLESNTDVYFTDDTRIYSSEEGYYKSRFPLQLLKNSKVYLSDSKVNNELVSDIHYTYYDACIHNKGLGFCGFGKVRTIDFSTSYDFEITSIEERDPEYMGVTKKMEKSHRLSQNSPFEITEYSYSRVKKWNPRLVKQVQKDLLKDFTATILYEYDNYDYPKSIKTKRTEGSELIFEETRTIEYRHLASVDNYLLGSVVTNKHSKINHPAYIWIPNASIPEYDIEPISLNTYSLNSNLVQPVDPLDPIDPVDPGDPIKPVDPNDPIFPVDSNKVVQSQDMDYMAAIYLVEQQTFTYDDRMQPLSRIDSVGIDLVAQNKKMETHWTYDSYGNVLTEISVPYNVESFIGKSYTYDVQGINLTSIINEKGQITRFSDFNKFGKPTRSVDHAGRITTMVYDDWGNQVSQTLSDGTVILTNIAWSGEGGYTVMKSSTGRPTEIVQYDALGREVRSGAQRFDGEWIFTAKEYAKNGQIARESLPFKSDGAPTLWNTFAYDEYQRPINYTQASGNITTWSYDGRMVTESKNGIWSTKTSDCLGQITKIQDAGGTITNFIRVDGQPLRIMLSNGPMTRFYYDIYGRRTKIEDPSAGIQTDTVVFSPDGSSISTHTNPNGTIITYNDKFGRTTKVERLGEYTTDYTYDLNGLLVSEISSNGTSKLYQYDAYDRVISITETVPDGKWLKKTYTYLEGSNVGTITYESQDGVIATEYFEYSNGTNVKIEIETEDVLSLISENEFGQPTSVLTGDIARTYSYDSFGKPTGRTMGEVMDFSYSFDSLRGNLMSRTDNLRSHSESFGYDELNRLVSMDTRGVTYSDYGNIISIDSVGDMTYDNSAKPYQVTSLTLEDDVVPSRVQNVTYTCYSRPSIMTEGGRSAAFTYNGDGARVKMNVSDGAASVLSRYYIGNQYELDVTPNGTTERLYLGGDAYSAPAVYVKEDSGAWTFYNIGRDYLGNITHIATADGTLVEENSYDPWGRLRNPETREIYSLGTEPELMLGRGYTGHEHLTWFGLINMNARLYDPVLGRFLSPDPFVQMPDFTQNFNRYSYCLNNPLVYVDENGEFCVTTMLIVGGICAAVFGAGNLAAHAIRGDDLGQGNWAKYFFSGALAGFAVGSVGYAAFAGASAMASSSIGLVRGFGKTAAFGMKWLPTAATGVNLIGSAANGIFNQNDQWFNNFAKSIIGNFYLDENKSFWGQVGEGISRFTWEYPQQMLGYGWTSISNIWSDRVDYFGGTTFVTNQGANSNHGITMGNFINIDIEHSITGSFDNYILTDSMYMHEYGHKIDSSKYGLSYLFTIGVPSLITAMGNKYISSHYPLTTHSNSRHEISANKNASKYFSKFGVNWSTLPDIYYKGYYAIDRFPLIKL